MTYTAVYSSLLLAGLLSAGRRNGRTALYYLALVSLFAFVAFRFEVGCDWRGYLNIYQSQAASTIEAALGGREPLFGGVVGLLHLWGLDYPYINVISAAIYFLGYHRLALRQPDRLGFLALSFPLLILHLAMSGIRQATAIGILCIAFNAFTDRRLASYVVLVLLAAGFHRSAAIFLALAPFVYGEFTRRRMLLGFAIALPGLFFLAASEEFSLYYDRYVDSGIEAFGAPFRAGAVSIVGLAFILFLRRDWRRLWPKDHKLLYLGSLAMIAMFPLALYSSVIGDRMGYYLMPLMFVILARLGYVYRSPVIVAAPYVGGAVLLLGWIGMSSLYQRCYAGYETWLFGG